MTVVNPVCDFCGETITDLGAAMVVGVTPRQTEAPHLPAETFLVVHKNIDGRTCDPDKGDEPTWELSHLIDPVDGLSDLLALLSVGPIKIAGHDETPSAIDNFVDLVRRLHVPGYEQARPHFHDEAVAETYSAASETMPYTAHELRGIPTLADVD